MDDPRALCISSSHCSTEDVPTISRETLFLPGGALTSVNHDLCSLLWLALSTCASGAYKGYFLLHTSPSLCFTYLLRHEYWISLLGGLHGLADLLLLDLQYHPVDYLWKPVAMQSLRPQRVVFWFLPLACHSGECAMQHSQSRCGLPACLYFIEELPSVFLLITAL
ncbi:uncharacterized protein LOC142813867 isoform X1 [Rhipicephalus microplus]|uniref:uncharacterized protein LOC142813867 isoform X1 n=1 Tax=Rhipicephalus microplus TaxID=6941 RepID=UPI003F6B80BB